MIFILNAFWNFLTGGISARGMDKERVVLLPRLPLSKAQPEASEPEASEESLIPPSRPDSRFLYYEPFSLYQFFENKSIIKNIGVKQICLTP